MLFVHVSPDILNQLMDFQKIGCKHYAVEGISRACGPLTCENYKSIKWK
jgi:hypothetical protein